MEINMDISWETEAEKIKQELLRDMTFYNSAVNDFIDYNNRYFVVASKGIGKTLLLKLKRYILEKEDGKEGGGKEGKIYFLPSSKPYLDFSEDFSQLDKNQKHYLESWENSKFLWLNTLKLTIISFLVKEKNLELNELKTAPSLIQNILLEKESHKPNFVFDYLLQYDSISKISDILISNRPLINTLYEICVTSGIYVFIDRLDQALRKCSKRMWVSMQVGLLEASWDLMRINNHVKIFCSIRQEAYYNYESPNKLALSGSITFIKYSQQELIKLLDKLTHFYEGVSIYEFIGTKSFTHPITNIEENVDEYILRHTVSRPRDLVALASKIHLEKREFDADSFRYIINSVANQEIALNLFSENEIFLDSLSKLESRNEFLALLYKNVLNLEEVIDICREYNNQSRCNLEKCSTCELHHPFSELYNIGLIGIVHKSDIGNHGNLVQKFQQPHEIKEGAFASLPVDSHLFLIHPALNSYIRQQRNRIYLKTYDVMQFIRIGNGIPWTEKHDYAVEFYSIIVKTNNEKLLADLLKLFSSANNGNKESLKQKLNEILTTAAIKISIPEKFEKLLLIGEKLIDII